jgi:hypothetical protein
MTEYRLLRMLEKDPKYIPARGRRRADGSVREPFWRPAPPPITSDVHIPRWNSWTFTALPGLGEPMATLDANAGYLAAASSVTVAHGALKHTGRHPHMTGTTPHPGYYLVTNPGWWHHQIVSPLGQDVPDTRVWIPHPTLSVLLQRQEEGHWPDVVVHDSYTSEDPGVRLRSWTTRLNAMRAELIDQGKPPAYEDFKTAYSQAVTMMLTGDKCQTRRPDWTHAILAQHAANMWRKSWRLTEAGHDVIRLGNVDEITLSAGDLAALISRAEANPARTVVRIDQSGRTLGSFKVKREFNWGDPDPEEQSGE